MPSVSAASGVESVDHALVVGAAPGAVVPSSPAAPGTLISPYDSPTVYVVGADGQLHGFATPTQLLGDGYDPAGIITTPSLGGLPVGPTAGSQGPSLDALATLSNGAIIDSSGQYYVLAGGHAFSIPGSASLQALESTDIARPLPGAVGPALSAATIEGGVLLTVSGAVYVSYGATLFPFKSVSQLVADGYGGTPSIQVPDIGDLSVAWAYSGS